MQTYHPRIWFIATCCILCLQPDNAAVAQVNFENEPALAKDDPLAPAVLEIRKKLRGITGEEWLKLLTSADEAYKAERFRESLRLYKEAENLIMSIDPGSDETEIPKEEEAKLEQRVLNFPLTLAENYAVLAQYRSAKELLQRLLEVESEQIENPSRTVRALNQLAEINRTLGLITEANEQIDRASKIAEDNKLVDENSVKTTVLRANRLFNESNFAASKTLYSNALSLAGSLGNSGKGLKAASLDGLARIAYLQGKIAEAEQQQAQSLALRKEAFGEDSLESTHSMMILAEIKEKRAPSEARSIRLKSLSIQLKRLETSAHPTIGNTMLALIDLKLQPAHVAEDACGMARSTVDGIVNEGSPFFATYLLKLAKVLSNEGKTKPGLETCQRAISLNEKLYGERSLSVANGLCTLAQLQLEDAVQRSMALGNFENIQCPEAAKSCRAAISIADERLGKGSEVAAYALSTLARNEKLAGDNALAEENSKNALMVLESRYGSDSEIVRSEKLFRLKCLTSLKKRTDARLLAAELLNAQIKQNGVFNKEVVDLLRTASKTNPDDPKDSGNNKNVESALPKSNPTVPLINEVEANKKKFAVVLGSNLPFPLPPEPETDHVLASLAMILIQKMPEDDTGIGSIVAMLKSHYEGSGSTVDLYKTELEKEEQTNGNDSPFITRSLVRLATAYSETQNYSDATAAFKRAISIIDTGLGSDHPALIEVLTKYSEMLKASGNEKEAAIQTARCAAIQAEGKQKK